VRTKAKGNRAPGGGAGGESGAGGLSWMSPEKLEKEMEKAVVRVKRADAELTREAVYRDPDKCKLALAERDSAAADAQRLEEEWLRRADGT